MRKFSRPTTCHSRETVLFFPNQNERTTTMKNLHLPLARVLALSLFLPLTQTAQGADKVPSVLNFEMKSLNGKPVKLSKYDGKVLLVVNVASQCGATPQ